MPDPNPARLPKYRRYKPKDLAVVRIDGHDHYLGRYGSEESREKYRRLIAEWLGRLPQLPAGGKAADAEGLTISELILAYLTFAEGYYRKDGRPTREPVN